MKIRGLGTFGLDLNFVFVLGILILLMALSYQRGGEALVREGLGSGARLLLRYAFIIVVSFLVAGFAEKLVPREWVEQTLGNEAGLRGLAIATVMGIATPSGPFVSLPIAAAMLGSGAGAGTVVTFYSSWALLALHRFVAWEVPILGLQLAGLRWLASLALPILAGLLVRMLTRS